MGDSENRDRTWVWALGLGLVAFLLGLAVAFLPDRSKKALQAQLDAEQAKGELKGVKKMLKKQLDAHNEVVDARSEERESIADNDNDDEALDDLIDAIGRRDP